MEEARYVEDAPMNLKNLFSTVFTPEVKATVIVFQRYTLLPWMIVYMLCNTLSPA
ncbi:MAG: hypothetical protein H6940_13440 [Burkholderiales bacterium]|nr:hypothetical protein [Burkholderiales bacterium]